MRSLPVGVKEFDLGQRLRRLLNTKAAICPWLRGLPCPVAAGAAALARRARRRANWRCQDGPASRIPPRNPQARRCAASPELPWRAGLRGASVLSLMPFVFRSRLRRDRPDGANLVTDKTANKMWGGRFCHVARRDHGGDKRLHRLRQGVWPPRISAPPRRMRRCWPTQGIITKDGRARDRRGPRPRCWPRSRAGSLQFSRALEDVHMNVESRLKELIGDAGRAAAHGALAQRPGGDRLPALCARLDRRRRTRRWPRCSSRWRARPRPMLRPVMPGFTHLQPAQPVTFGHHLLAYVEMLGARPRPASPMRARGSTSARWAPPRSPARRFRSTGT